MFDWDNDQEDLVAPVATQITAKEQKLSGLRRKLGAFLVGAVLILAVAYEKDALPQLRSSAMAGMTLLAVSEPKTTVSELPDTLLVYDAAQAQGFLRGLQMASLATLRSYAARTEDDLIHAGSEFTPYLQDVAALLSLELARRGASAS